jgi:hypothetical protein
MFFFFLFRKGPVREYDLMWITWTLVLKEFCWFENQVTFTFDNNSAVLIVNANDYVFYMGLYIHYINL